MVYGGGEGTCLVNVEEVVVSSRVGPQPVPHLPVAPLVLIHPAHPQHSGACISHTAYKYTPDNTSVEQFKLQQIFVEVLERDNAAALIRL